jgi:hypothetical protein
MFSLPAEPTHRGLPLTIAHRSVVVQTFSSSHAVPTAAAVVPDVQTPALSHASPSVQTFPSHSRELAEGVPTHLVTLTPEGSLPRATHLSFVVQAL